MNNDKNGFLFSQDEMDSLDPTNLFNPDNQIEPVTCLGMIFESEDARREYFREELRKKLPELKQIEGFPIGEDDDIINLSDPPYYTACPNPWLNDFIEEWEKEKEVLEKEGKRNADFEVKEPYASDVSFGKYNDIYFKHPYHTKVPIAAIESYLKHYVQDGDIVLDGFAGTGMTGVASQMINKNIKAITSDLSPIACYVNSYYNNPSSKEVLRLKFSKVIEDIENRYSYLYTTAHDDSSFGKIESIIWSEVFICPHCSSDVVFWGNGVDIKNGKVLKKIHCPNCSGDFTKNEVPKNFVTEYDTELDLVLPIVKIVPVRITYKYNDKSYYKKPDNSDLIKLKEIDSFKIPYWVPINEIPKGEKTPDALKYGIEYVNKIYFKRSLIVFAAFYNMIDDTSLLGILTSVAFRITKRYALTYMSGKWGAGGGPTNGTYYIPSLLKELNAFEVLRSAYKKCERAYFSSTKSSIISTQSSTNFLIPSNSIDYIFTDPPFGGNFIYSELNYIWESWLKVFTNNKEESITSTTYNKGFEEYHKLMKAVFSEYYRVLKPKRWISIEFSNTKAKIWNILQLSLQEAGFVIVNVSSLDKQKGSFNAQTSSVSVKQDLIVTCYKPVDDLSEMSSKTAGDSNVWNFIDTYLERVPRYRIKNSILSSVLERTPKIIFDRFVSYNIQRSLPITLDSGHFQKKLSELYIERDGMIFSATQASEYEDQKRNALKFVSLGIIVSDEASGIQWLINQLRNSPKTYNEISPEWMQATNALRKNDILPELKQILEENFIKMEDGKWRLPNIRDDVDKEALRTKSLLREFKKYVEAASKPKAKIKEARVEALRAGFKQCYIDKDFKTIVLVGDKIPQNLRDEDEILLQFYDIALNKM